MKRIALWALVLFLATASFAADTERYFVATRHPVRAIGASAVTRELGDTSARRISTFSIVNGFSASLTASEAAKLRQSPDVRYVEPVVSRQLHALNNDPISKAGEQLIPYGISLVHAPEAWLGTLGGEVNVVIIDTGIDNTHAELKDAYQGGVNTIDPAASPMDDHGHGTHVAGTVAAANNNLGVVGVAPSVRLWAIKAFDKNGDGSSEDVMEGLDWVVTKKKAEGGRWIVNISAGGQNTSTAEAEAVARTIAEGVVIVSSSGNASKVGEPAKVNYPGAHPNVVTVSAVDEQGAFAPFSNQGPEVDFTAPGVRVLSLGLHGTIYVSYVRTSDNKIIDTKPLLGAKREAFTGQYVNCGLGTAADFGPHVAGKIALIQRGGDTFAEKVKRAKEAGAAAAVIYNNVGGQYYWTLYPEDDPDAKNYPWPVAVGMSMEDGEALAAKGTGTIAIGLDPDDYGVRSGTSMSTPHVTGAIAHVWALAPNATPQQVINALISTAKDIGSAGKDDQTGYGLIDVNAAAHMLAPSAFGRTGRRFLKRR
ncbi:MAG TPA: S8 family serine peptidase [Thermoanaerobaculia bacterium]|jgi:subtilisin family serine protease